MAVAVFNTPNPRVWLEIDNFSTVGHANNTGQFGEFTRGAAFGFNDETLLFFDTTSISGTVTAVTLQITCNNAGGQSVFTTTSNLYEQDKTIPASWSSPPVYNDFANANIDRIVAIAPRTEPLETPIDDPTKIKHTTSWGHTYYDHTIKEKGVDTQSE